MDGEYPFLLTPYFPDAQQAHGHGIIEIFRQTARYIDKLERLQLRNIIESSKQRKLVRDGCGIDMDKLRDMEEEIIPVANPDGCVISLPAAQPLSGAAYTLYSTKISSLKDESGQNLFNRGEGGKGVTAASAIIALQEAGSKRTRMAVKDQYAAHRRLIRMVIQRVMQFYSGDRVFLLRGKQARRMHSDTMVFDANAYLRSDRRLDFDFDIDIEAQIATPANKVYHNETVFQMFNLVLQYGAQPQLLESLVYMLDIPGKEELLDALQTLWLNLQEQQRAQTAQADLAAQQDTLQLMQAFPELFSSEQVSALQSLGIQASDTPAMDPLGRGEG